MNLLLRNTVMLLSMVFGALLASAYDFEVGGLYYTITSLENLECKLAKGPIEYAGKIEIPNEVSYKNRGLKVTEIEPGVFQDSQIESVSIPSGIALHEAMFQDCSQLRSLLLPDNLSEIPSDFLHSCTSLESMSIPKSVKKARG